MIVIEKLTTELPTLTIKQIAVIIALDWKKNGKPNVYFGAVPYLEAMFTLETVKDNYGADSGKSIVAYFLSNAATWKGEVAKLVKKELNKRIK
jgi:hypothetical protein